MWHGSYVSNRFDLQTGSLQRRNRRFAPCAKSLNADLDFAHTEFLGLFRGQFRGTLGGERRTLPAPLESSRPCRSPAKYIAVWIGDGDNRIVERSLDVGDAACYRAFSFPFFRLSHTSLPRLIRRGGFSTMPSRAVPSRPSCPRRSYVAPYGCEHWFACAGRAPAGHVGGGSRGNIVCP